MTGFDGRCRCWKRRGLGGMMPRVEGAGFERVAEAFEARGGDTCSPG